MTGAVMMSRARASAGCSVVLMRFLLWAGLEPLDGGRQELDDVAAENAVGTEGMVAGDVTQLLPAAVERLKAGRNWMTSPATMPSVPTAFSAARSAARP